MTWNFLDQVEKKIKDAQNIPSMDLIMQLSMIDEGGEGLKDNLNILRSYINTRKAVLMDVTDNDLKVREMDSLIKEQRQLIFKSIALIHEKIDLTEDDYKEKRDEIHSKFLTPSIVQNIENIRLQRQATIDQKYYDLFLEKKAEYAISKAGYTAETRKSLKMLPIPTWILSIT